jgi:hypothetical protein
LQGAVLTRAGTAPADRSIAVPLSESIEADRNGHPTKELGAPIAVGEPVMRLPDRLKRPKLGAHVRAEGLAAASAVAQIAWLLRSEW